MHLDGVSLRYFNVFGPRQDPGSPYSGVISLFARALLDGRRPVIFGDGLQSRDFTYVQNAVQANLLALKCTTPLRGEVFNVGTGRRITLLDLLAAMNTVLGTSIEPDLQAERAGDVRHSLASLDRIQTVLGYQPAIDFESGVRLTLEWARTQG
jgi:UDP-glucose 4-epimerase